MKSEGELEKLCDLLVQRATKLETFNIPPELVLLANELNGDEVDVSAEIIDGADIERLLAKQSAMAPVT